MDHHEEEDCDDDVDCRCDVDILFVGLHLARQLFA